jgi:twinkle protein
MDDFTNFAPPLGYFQLGGLPQTGPVDNVAFGSGWPELDSIFKFYPNQLVLVTGYTGHGKSTFMLNVIAKLALEQKIGSFLYVPENENYLLHKMKLLWPGNDAQFQRFCNGLCSVQSAVPYDYNQPNHDIQWALGRAEYAVVHDKREIIFLDPWNEFDRYPAKGQLMTDYIGQALILIKQFCRQYKVTVVMVAHPSKQAMQEDRPMNLADIEGSMNWGNKSDNILIISRSKCTAKIISAKVREIGAGFRGQCEFSVDMRTGKFTPIPGSDILDV